MAQQIDVPGMGIVEFPDGMNDDQIAAAIKKNMPANPKPQGFMANAADFLKSIPRGLVSGATSAQNPSFVPMEDVNMEMAPLREGSRQALIDKTYAPQGGYGKVGQAVGEGLGNPLSYVGPGGLPLKVGGAVLSSAAGEGAAQGAEALGGGEGAQTAARLGGSVLGGAVAAKTFGPTAPKAATPTAQELRTAADRGYAAARNSGLELDVRGPASWATRTEQELIGPDYGFSGKVAPKTFGVIQELQSPPAGATIAAGNLDALRKNLGRIAQETSEGKPTADAAAASIVLKRYQNYLENLPQDHIVAGDAAAYVGAIRQANGDYAAFQRTRDFDSRLTKAENATDRQVAGSLDSQIKQKAGQLLDSTKARGLNEAERDQLQLINSGGPVSNTMRQLGRGGAGVIPIMGQLAAAPFVASAGGPLGLALQGGLAAALYGARKGSEAITSSRANKLVEMLAQRSPEYEQRLANLPPADTSPGTAAILRALLAR